jgi:hypothetical protein
MSVLQALHCCTASLQALQARAAAHNNLGCVLNAGCSKTISKASMSLAVCCSCD